MTRRLTFTVVLLATAPAIAQPAPKAPPARAAQADDMAAFEKDLDSLFVQGGLTANGAAARAAKASPVVRRKAAELDAALAQLETARLAQVPQLAGKASYTRLSFVAPFVIPFMGQNFMIPSLQNQYVVQGALTVPLSDYVVRFPKLIDTAKLGEQAAKLGERSAEVGAGNDARLAYYEWVRARLQVLIAQRQLAQVQATLVQEQALADVQRISRADLLRVQSQEAEAEQVVDQLTNLSQLREEQLRLLIGAGDGESLAIGEDIRKEVATPQPGSLDDLLQHATSHRLEVRGLDIGIAAKQSQLASEKANQYPRLSAFASADYDRPNQRVFPQTDEFRFTWLAGVQLTWTINDLLISRATEDRIHAEAGELRADRENLLRGTRLEILAAGQAVQIALHSLRTSQKGLTAAEEGYRVRRELLNAERATALELVDAQTDLTRARIAALNARVDLRVALAQLVHALGDDTGPPNH